MKFTKCRLELLSALIEEKAKETYALGNTSEGIVLNNRFFKSFPEGLGDVDNLKTLDKKLQEALKLN
ncbi:MULTISPECIES: hypothetical protein [Bacillus]|uniref:hypothetical protein n=1 Tax=Bacillus TaxID=1386 RepID=UPI000BF5DAA7|nr:MULTISPECIES: hypothetical protein [Bacillus]PFA84502.1 hypothetical protein CN393_27530 [Bacillus cereus]